MKPEAKEVSPRKVLAEVAAAVPSEVHPNIIIIGSLAAAWWLFRGDDALGVRTKDIDCVLSPHLSVVEKGRAVAEKLLAAGWQPRREPPPPLSLRRRAEDRRALPSPVTE